MLWKAGVSAPAICSAPNKNPVAARLERKESHFERVKSLKVCMCMHVVRMTRSWHHQTCDMRARGVSFASGPDPPLRAISSAFAAVSPPSTRPPPSASRDVWLQRRLRRAQQQVQGQQRAAAEGERMAGDWPQRWRGRVARAGGRIARQAASDSGWSDTVCVLMEEWRAYD